MRAKLKKKRSSRLKKKRNLERKTRRKGSSINKQWRENEKKKILLMISFSFLLINIEIITCTLAACDNYITQDCPLKRWMNVCCELWKYQLPVMEASNLMPLGSITMYGGVSSFPLYFSAWYMGFNWWLLIRNGSNHDVLE